MEYRIMYFEWHVFSNIIDRFLYGTIRNAKGQIHDLSFKEVVSKTHFPSFRTCFGICNELVINILRS
jgi:hypothetical protein